MKLERSTKEYGCGSGWEIFKSSLFRVVKWNMSKGKKTTIECKLIDTELDFDGTHELITDEMCMEQFTYEEIIEMFDAQIIKYYEAGQKAKAKEIRNCLNISNR